MTSPAPRNLTLYTNHLTPNGLKVSIYLEELRAVDPTIEYSIVRVDLPNAMHKEPWFIQLNPDGRIPVLVDHSLGDFAISESAAILLYLERYYDKSKCMSFDSAHYPKEYGAMLQWILFAHGGISPIQGQAHYFFHYSPENIPYAKKRYHDETKRLYSVVNTGLRDRDWLVGEGRGAYSIADVNMLPWIRIHPRAGIENLEEWPDLKVWFLKCMARPAVRAAIRSVSM